MSNFAKLSRLSDTLEKAHEAVSNVADAVADKTAYPADYEQFLTTIEAIIFTCSTHLDKAIMQTLKKYKVEREKKRVTS